MRVADYIMYRLSEVGIKHVFQVTGRGSLFLSDALAKNNSLIGISLHHEQSCAFAAIAYAEKRKSLGACLVSTGCASTNAITGVLSAWQDGVPCVFISGQNILRETVRHTKIPIRTFGQQESDIISLVTPITKYAHMLQRKNDIIEVMDMAIYHAQNGRKGPVWLDIPLDLQSATIDDISFEQNEKIVESIENASNNDIEIVANDLRESKRPIVLIGKGVRSSGSEELLRLFIESWNLPLTYTASAPDIYGTSNKLSIGSVGAMGCSRAGNFAIQNADYVLVLGSRLSSLTTGPDYCKFARAARIAVIDIDSLEHSKPGIRIDHFVKTDIRYFLTAILDKTSHRAPVSWVEKCLHWKNQFSKIEADFNSTDFVDLYQLAFHLGKKMPVGTTLITDSGLTEVILPTNVQFSPGTQCIHPTSQGVMGFALPACIGTKFATENPVLAVVGDGSIMMNIQELESIRYHRLPVKIIIINNNVYSIIRKRQIDLFRKRTIGTDPANGLSCPDFEKIAQCFQFKYHRIKCVEELEEGLNIIFRINEPVICEVMGRVNQSYIELGHARSSIDKRILRRPLEDQEPFLPRNIFLSEMIIDPIDQ
jgi:acetolactate synthase-1/2/3 large subunit